MNKAATAILMIIFLLLIMHLSATNDMPIIAAFQGEHHNSCYGYSMVSLDYNHDGIDDLAVCSYSYGYVYGELPARGKVYIYFGGAGFSSNTQPSVTMEGSVSGNTGRRIWQIFKIGDISGDSFDDLCVYVEDESNYKKLLFFFGGTPNLDSPDHVINITDNIYTFGWIYPLGDYNGDGFADMGIRYRHSPSYLNRLSIIRGMTFSEQVVSSGELSTAYSSSINGIGDIDNDGFEDFTTAFATPSSNPTHNLIRLYYGNAAGSTDSPIVFIDSPSGISRGSKPLGDMNADGYDDFMGYITNNGMHAWLGGTNINYIVPNFNMDPIWYGGENQRSLEHGDFNNDGFEDAVGANYDERGFAVWLGKQSMNGTADLIKYNGEYENFGFSLVTGDFNIDGYDDVAIAASHEYDPWPEGNFNGYVWVYAGNAQLSDTTVAIDDQVIPGVSEHLVINLSPNPIAHNDQAARFILKGFTCPAPIIIEVYNIKGQCVYRMEKNVNSKNASYELPVDSLSNGVYLCRATSGKLSAISKFSIVR